MTILGREYRNLTGLDDPAVDNTADLASNVNGLGASLVGLEDAGALVVATDVEGAIAEVAASIATAAPAYIPAAPTTFPAPSKLWWLDGDLTEQIDGDDLTATAGSPVYVNSPVSGRQWCKWDNILTTAYNPGTGLGNQTDYLVDGAYSAVLLAAVSAGDGYFFAVGASTEDPDGNQLLGCGPSADATSVFRAFHEHGLGTNELVSSGYGIDFHHAHVYGITRTADGLTHKFYIDGVLVDTVVASNAPEGSLDQYPTVGAFIGNSGQFEGYMSTLGLWLGTDLTEDQMAIIANHILGR